MGELHRAAPAGLVLAASWAVVDPCPRLAPRVAAGNSSAAGVAENWSERLNWTGSLQLAEPAPGVPCSVLLDRLTDDTPDRRRKATIVSATTGCEAAHPPIVMDEPVGAVVAGIELAVVWDPVVAVVELAVVWDPVVAVVELEAGVLVELGGGVWIGVFAAREVS
jgi:hypothetical protein